MFDIFVDGEYIMRGGGMGVGWWIIEWVEGCMGIIRGGGVIVIGE